MGRPILHVRVDQEVLDRIDGCCGELSRSDWVRGLIEAALSGNVQNAQIVQTAAKPAVTKEPVVDKVAAVKREIAERPKPRSAPPGYRPNPYSTRAQDKLDLLALIRSQRLTSRQAKEALGWLGLRYENAERSLMSDGTLWFRDGLLEVLE